MTYNIAGICRFLENEKELRFLKYCPNFAACKRKNCKTAMGKKPKTYNPGRRVNLIMISKRLEKLRSDTEHLKQLYQSIIEEHNRHFEYLSNFVRHDMKNAIQGLDGIIYNAEEEGKVDSEILFQLKTTLSLLQSTLDNFTRIIPSSRVQTTTLPDVFVAVEAISRYDIQRDEVECVYAYDRESSVRLSFPFQTLVQIVNNLVKNALNAYEEQSDRKLLIEGQITGERCRIAVHDNAPAIPEADKQRIFEYGYSTTGGTGIGLFHAKIQMDRIGGSITLSESGIEGYTKCFVIEFPIQ